MQSFWTGLIFWSRKTELPVHSNGNSCCPWNFTQTAADNKINRTHLTLSAEEECKTALQTFQGTGLKSGTRHTCVTWKDPIPTRGIEVYAIRRRSKNGHLWKDKLSIQNTLSGRNLQLPMTTIGEWGSKWAMFFFNQFWNGATDHQWLEWTLMLSTMIYTHTQPHIYTVQG